MAAIQEIYQGLLANTPRTHHLSHVKRQLQHLPASWITGWFDKGTSALWAGCKNFWYPRFHKAFFQQPKRFTELQRTQSPADASEQAFRFIVSGAKSFLSKGDEPWSDVHLHPDLGTRLSDRVQMAKGEIPKKYAMSKEFQETWKQALNACDTKLQSYITRADPSNRVSNCKSNRQYTKGLRGKYRPHSPDEPPPLITPLHAPLEPDPAVCSPPPKYAEPEAQGVPISGPVIVRDSACYETPTVSYHTTGGRHGKARCRALPAPNCQLLLKYKSSECASPPVIKMREVLTYACHPFQKICKLMGRALTLLWKMAINVLKSRELIAMPQMLHTIKTWLSRIDVSRATGTGLPFWTEMDVKEMFPEIPRSDIIPALVWIHDQLKEKKKTRGPVEFYLAKDGNRKMDNTAHGSKDFFYKFTFHDVVHYMVFELHLGDIFVSLSSVMSQNTGIPIGGSTSAQAASLVLIYRELRGDLPAELNDLMWLRYRDNFLVLHQPTTHDFSLDLWTMTVQQGFATMTDMEITIEQQGQQLTFLECELNSP